MASPSLFSQKAGFLNSEAMRQQMPEVEQAEQSIKTIVDEWKIEITAMQEQINKLETEIRNNRLIWSDKERQKNESDLEKLVKTKSDYSSDKFRPGGEFDKIVKQIQEPIESKIYNTVR
jgi:outer membrane protein